MSTAKFDTLSNLDGTLTIPVSTVAQGTARAWVNFNGTGTPAIRASFNVSSITRNGTGDYTVNFTTALPDADYSPSLAGGAGTDNLLAYAAEMYGTSFLKTTTQYRLVVFSYNTGTPADRQQVNAQFFR
jgi:hypothetical protein